MQPLPDLTGQKFHRLLVKQMMGLDAKHHTLCLCTCDCGGEILAKAAEVLSGHVQSCGCLQKNRKPDLTGRRFGRLVARRYAGKDQRNNRTYECDCDCGKTKVVAATQLVHGYVESCGCLLQEKRNENMLKAQAAQLKHGLSGTSEYKSWLAMMSRCFEKTDERYPRYGGVGITVCQGLQETPVNLVALLGEKPTIQYSVDRYPDPKGSYTCGQCPECKANKRPKNVRWATPQEQAVNRRSTVWVEIEGVLKTRTQAALDLGIPYAKAVYLLKPYEVTTKPIEFKPPAGVVPEGLAAGEDFDLVCTFRVKRSGMVCLTMLGDVKMPGYGEREDRGGSRPSYDEEAKAMTAEAPQEEG